MKIFAYNLCLQLEVKKSEENHSFSSLSFEELTVQFFNGLAFESQVFYLKGESTEEFFNNIYDFQRNENWRNLTATIILQFATQNEMNDFLTSFNARFKPMKAAGGLVCDADGQYLVIYCRDKWDLPKGGVDKGEEIPDAAIREVQEETSIQEVSIAYKLPCTYHTFFQKNKWRLKTTHWFRMNAPAGQTLVPEAKENIMEAKWVSKNEWMGISTESYPLIRELFEAEFLAKSVSPI